MRIIVHNGVGNGWHGVDGIALRWWFVECKGLDCGLMDVTEDLSPLMRGGMLRMLRMLRMLSMLRRMRIVIFMFA